MPSYCLADLSHASSAELTRLLVIAAQSDGAYDGVRTAEVEGQFITRAEQEAKQRLVRACQRFEGAGHQRQLAEAEAAVQRARVDGLMSAASSRRSPAYRQFAQRFQAHLDKIPRDWRHGPRRQFGSPRGRRLLQNRTLLAPLASGRESPRADQGNK